MVTRFPTLVLVFACHMAVAQELSPLPEPLTLEYALAQAESAHPALMQADAERELARANLAASEAQNGLNIWAEGRLRWIQPPSYASNQSHDDHKAGLYARKSLYDFGRSSARVRSAEAELRSRELRYLSRQSQRRIEIMQRYFEVLIADMEFGRDDEAMAVAYVTLDKLRQRHELGQVSDIDLLQQEASYQQSLRQRSASEARQRTTREMLAIALAHPGQLSSTLTPPEFPLLPVKAPEYEQLLQVALHNNPQLRALREEQTAAQERVASARAAGRPTLYGEAEAAGYSRKLATNDPLRIGVVLQVPLYNGGAVDAAAAQEQARLYRTQAELQAGEDELRQTLLQLWQELELLRIQEAEAKAQMEYRELYLDRSRANYEMEVSTDLGDAMVRLSEAQLAQARIELQRALAWERLRAVTGESRLGSEGQVHSVEQSDAQKSVVK